MADAKKSAPKFGARSNPLKKGPDPRRGNGPKKGAPNAGRPPDAFRLLCRDIATRGAQALIAEKVMKDPKHPAFQTALRWATENGYGKAPQTLEHTGKAGGPIETRDLTDPRSDLAARIATIVARTSVDE